MVELTTVTKAYTIKLQHSFTIHAEVAILPISELRMLRSASRLVITGNEDSVFIVAILRMDCCVAPSNSIRAGRIKAANIPSVKGKTKPVSPIATACFPVFLIILGSTCIPSINR